MPPSATDSSCVSSGGGWSVPTVLLGVPFITIVPPQVVSERTLGVSIESAGVWPVRPKVVVLPDPLQTPTVSLLCSGPLTASPAPNAVAAQEELRPAHAYTAQFRPLSPDAHSGSESS
jgi:hypothetical protein